MREGQANEVGVPKTCMKAPGPNVSKPLPVCAPAGAGPTRRAWLFHSLAIIGLLVANFVLYRGTLDLGFFSVDDADYVLNNPYIVSLSAPNLKHMLTTPYFANYAPANLLSYAVDVALAGGKVASSMHLSNMMWHGWVVCMVYVLGFAITNEILIATAAACLFLLHPTHVEVVAWLSSRKDLVATGFALLSMTCFVLWRRRVNARMAAVGPESAPNPGRPASSARREWRAAFWYIATLLCFLVASAAKQSVLLLPGVMVCWDVLVDKRRNWRMLADKIPFALISVCFGLMTWKAQPSTNQASSAFVLATIELTNLWLLTGFGQYVLFRPAPDPAVWNQAIRFVMILSAILVWPVPLLLTEFRTWFFPGRSRAVAIGPPPPPARASAPKHSSRYKSEHVTEIKIDPESKSRACASVWPICAVFCYWVLIQMIPPAVLSFIVPITDRYLFLPSGGFCILLAVVGANLMKKVALGSWLSAAFFVCLASVWSVKTFNYINEWRDPRSVWYGAHLKSKTPHNFEYLGDAYQEAAERINNFLKVNGPLKVTNELKLAQAVLNDTSKVEKLREEWHFPGSLKTNTIAYRDELWALAWEEYQEAFAHRGTVSTPNLFMNRGRLLVTQGKYEQSIPEFQTALRFAQTSTFSIVREGTSAHALYAIGVAYWNMRNYKLAQQWLEEAEAIQKQSGQAWIPTLEKDMERLKPLAAGQQ
jgi:hypothetical protein